MKSMTLSLDRANASHLITNALIGVSAHIYEASNAPKSMRESFLEQSLGFADHVALIVDKVFDGFGFTDDKDSQVWTFEKENYVLDIDGAGFLMLLTAIRSTFEMYMYANAEARYEIVCPINDVNFPKEFLVTEKDRLKCARSSHCLLDFLESHCDDSLLLRWRDLRKETSREMLATLTDKWVGVEDE